MTDTAGTACNGIGALALVIRLAATIAPPLGTSGSADGAALRRPGPDLMPAELELLERLASAQAAGVRAPSKRMLVIVNPYATTVSDRLKNLVVYALRGRYEVEAVDTEQRGHATEICREAAHEGYDVVVSFGGDGTLNEVVNGLAGSETPLTCLPGGATNVYCRLLGIPNEIVDATEHILRLADDWAPRRVDVGKVNDRWFAFSSGIGLDASVVERVDRHPHLKARFGEYYFTYAAVTTFARRYLLRPPAIAVQTPGERLEGVTAIVQNARPYTFFRRRGIDLAEESDLTSANLAGVVLRRASPLDMPTVLWRAFSQRARIVRHRQVSPFATDSALRVVSVDGRPVPLQVDGDHIGEVVEAGYSVASRGLTVVS
jgi:diacylglycerol kinase family enzyme